jgi:hypothetical protein
MVLGADCDVTKDLWKAAAKKLEKMDDKTKLSFVLDKSKFSGERESLKP